MDERIKIALETDSVVDITTIGRKSGRSHRVEVNLRHVEGQIYLSNRPQNLRDWVANIIKTPVFIYHFTQSVQLDFRAEATPIHDPEVRRNLFSVILEREGLMEELEDRITYSNLFKVDFLE